MSKFVNWIKETFRKKEPMNYPDKDYAKIPTRNRPRDQKPKLKFSLYRLTTDKEIRTVGLYQTNKISLAEVARRLKWNGKASNWDYKMGKLCERIVYQYMFAPI